jgi:hypothetical protein
MIMNNLSKAIAVVLVVLGAASAYFYFRASSKRSAYVEEHWRQIEGRIALIKPGMPEDYILSVLGIPKSKVLTDMKDYQKDAVLGKYTQLIAYRYEFKIARRYFPSFGYFGYSALIFVDPANNTVAGIRSLPF